MKDAKPVYNSLLNYLKSEIKKNKLRPGDCIPGENFLAGKFKISRMSVRKALKVLIEEKSLLAKPGIGNFVMDRSETDVRKDFRVGLIYRRLSQTDVGMYAEAQNEICFRLNMEGIHVELLTFSELKEGHINTLSEKIDAFVWLFPNEGEFELIERFTKRNRKIQVLFLRYHPSNSECIAALIDEKQAIAQAVELLINYNHRKILFMYRAERQYNTLRLEAFKAAFRKNSRPVNPEHIINLSYSPGETLGEKVVHEISRLKPDAVFFSQGAIGVEALPFLYAKGFKLPEKFSLISIDKVSSPYDMEITFVDSDYLELARQTADYLVEQLKRPNLKRKFPVVKAKLIMGNSCILRTP
ncbi:MAG: hypothetical protein A2017_21555 [Lentisphaerae bacterium GWF2_44_16]|nr:MAG: hypothetical protein A2017_21555 [Lentisphaerae bacterium GWF2_44_16]